MSCGIVVGVFVRAMAYQALTRERYDKLVEAFRACPGQWAPAARRAGVDRETAKRAWQKGWPNHPWAIPIKTVFEEEQRTRATAAQDAAMRAQHAADAEKERARKEAQDAAKQEQDMLRLARNDVLASLALAAELAPAMRNLAAAVAEDAKRGPNGEAPAIKASMAMSLLRSHATLIQKAVGAAEALVQLGRTERGQPNLNVGFAPAPELSYEEAVLELQRAADFLPVLQQQGIIAPARPGLARPAPLLVEAVPVQETPEEDPPQEPAPLVPSPPPSSGAQVSGSSVRRRAWVDGAGVGDS